MSTEKEEEKPTATPTTIDNKQHKASFFLYQGNGGPWQCGNCDHINFDLRITCLKCKKGIRPPYRPNKSWPCTERSCDHYINSRENGYCTKCGMKKYDPSSISQDMLEKQNGGEVDEEDDVEVIVRKKLRQLYENDDTKKKEDKEDEQQ